MLRRISALFGTYGGCITLIAVSSLTAPCGIAAVHTYELQPEAVVAADNNQPPRRLTTRHPPRMAAARELFLPEAISREDLDQFARILELSDAQVNFLRVLYDQYLDDNTSLKESRLEALWERAIRAAEHGGSVLSDPETAREHTALYAAREEYVRKMAAVERRLFDLLEPALTMSQRQELDRVRMLRARGRNPVIVNELYGAAIDLTSIIDHIDHRDVLLIVDLDAFSAVVQQYERQLTSLRDRHWREELAFMTRGVELRAQQRVEVNERRREELIQSRRRLTNAAGQAEIALADLNELFVNWLAEHMDEETADMFRLHYLAAAYPRIFPNHHDARALLGDMQSRDELAEEVRAGIDGVAVRYDRELDRIHREMIRLTRDYAEFLALTRRSGGQREEAYYTELENLRSRRAQLAENALKDVLELLPPGEHVAFAERVEAFLSRSQGASARAHRPEVRIER